MRQLVVMAYKFNETGAETMSDQNQFLLYTAPDGAVKVDVVLKDQTVWLTQKALAELFGVKVPGINKHLKNIFDSDELKREATVSKMEIVRAEGDREVARDVESYNPNALVQKLWNYCNILRDDGLSYGHYVEQHTFLLFLKMADEQANPPFNKSSPVPKGYGWDAATVSTFLYEAVFLCGKSCGFRKVGGWNPLIDSLAAGPEFDLPTMQTTRQLPDTICDRVMGNV